MPEVHVYVSARDKAFIATLPPEVTVAEILRQALRARETCEHPSTEQRCARCGTVISSIDPVGSMEGSVVEVDGLDGGLTVGVAGQGVTAGGLQAAVTGEVGDERQVDALADQAGDVGVAQGVG